MQEALGKLDDLATVRVLVANEGAEWWQEQSEEVAYLREAKVALRSLGKADPFWRAEAPQQDKKMEALTEAPSG